MNRTLRLTILGSIALMALLAAPLVAREGTFKGTVTKIDKATLEITTGEAAAKQTVTFTVTEKTKVTRESGMEPVPLKIGDAVSVTVAQGDEAKTDWTCSMHPDVSEAGAGRCPKCKMALKERTAPAKAATIHVGGK